MGLNYIWDTNIAIYYLQKELPNNAEQFIDINLKENDCIISVITEIELLCWKNSTANDLKTIRAFLKNAQIIELENDIKIKTAELKKQFGGKLPDLIIAATAIVNNLTLFSRNTKDFIRISPLKFINPFEV